jgi:hypothetical protein
VLVLAGILLGVLSRLDETSGLTLLVSEKPTWLLAPFAAGALTRQVDSGLILLTAANVAYYAWMLVTDGALYGPVAYWFLVGWAAGLVCGALGAWARRVSAR